MTNVLYGTILLVNPSLGVKNRPATCLSLHWPNGRDAAGT